MIPESPEERLEILCKGLTTFVEKQMNVIKGEQMLIDMRYREVMEAPNFIELFFTNPQRIKEEADKMHRITKDMGIVEGKALMLETLQDYIIHLIEKYYK